ncbi:dipeptidase 2-like isoform X2 [Spea bombifrons]|uniref:dipeptidase 2-like isoform X2 n=1 Tax=Spea bombifrons TaxID=233779 RepID=UPI0023496395|nr:dipeptidase 2-like isoform X2 [Spea bombifrons]
MRLMSSVGLSHFITWIFCILPFISSFNDGHIKEQAVNLMKKFPLIDGHNDLALQLRKMYNNRLSKINLRTLNSTRTNLEKLKAGRVGAQFWSAYVLCNAQDKDAVRLTLEQIDVIKRMCKEYEELELVTSSSGISDSTKIACLIGLEGGHSIDSSLGTLRMFYDLGVRYMTLTHTCNTPWAETSATGIHSFYQRGTSLTEFGKEVIKEMNRIGMIIDLSHTSFNTSRAVLEITKAPVIFSHSAAFALCPRTRNVPDDILLSIRKNQGLVMVNFYTELIACGKSANISTVADHFDQIKMIAGAEYIGIGGDYDGVNGFPIGLEDASKYPSLIEELLRRGWSEEELGGVLRNNFLRVFSQVERVRDEQMSLKPNEEEVPADEVNYACRLDLRALARNTFLNSNAQESGRHNPIQVKP